MDYQNINELTKDMNIHLCEKEKEALYRYAKEVPENGVILDIGTLTGGSAFIMALASKPSVTVYTVDPIEHSGFLEMKTKLGLDNKVIFINEKSDNVIWNKLTIDMMFVDGWHSYEAVKGDYEHFGPYLKYNATVVFHDIFLYDNTIGLAVKELQADGKIEQIETIDDIFKDGKRIGMLISKQL